MEINSIELSPHFRRAAKKLSPELKENLKKTRIYPTPYCPETIEEVNLLFSPKGIHSGQNGRNRLSLNISVAAN